MSETKTKNLCTVPAADLTDSQYFIAEDGGELKRIPKVQVVLKKLEKMLATDTENLAGGGEVTAQKLLDVLAEQVANKLLAKSQVVNNLLATVEGNPLDATQGKALKDLIDTTNNNLSNKADKTSLSSYALKSDLTWNPVSISELNTNAVIPDGGLNNGANIYVSCGRLHIISLSLNLSSDINGSLFKVETGHIPVRSTRIVCTAKSGNITAMPYLDSDGYVITAGTIPAGQVKLLGIYMTA